VPTEGKAKHGAADVPNEQQFGGRYDHEARLEQGQPQLHLAMGLLEM
jgi:hypothetical protein